MSARGSQSPESVVREIRRNTRRKYTSEEKIRIVLEHLAYVADLIPDTTQGHLTYNIDGLYIGEWPAPAPPPTPAKLSTGYPIRPGSLLPTPFD